MRTSVKTALATSLICCVLGSVLSIEGDYVNDPDDNGGETRYGITEQVARLYGYKGEIKNLPKQLAVDIYTDLYIYQPKFDEILAEYPALGHKLIDAGINVGTSRVSLWLQEALNSFSNQGKRYPIIKVDGVIGTNTLSAIKNLSTCYDSVKACELLVKAIDAKQGVYYLSIPNQDKFRVGWFNQRIGNITIDQCKNYTKKVELIK